MRIKCDPRAIARCPYKRLCGDNPYFLDGSDCDKFNQKVLEPPPTMADCIRAKSDEELAEWLTEFSFEAFAAGVFKMAGPIMTKQERLDWLQQPAGCM